MSGVRGKIISDCETGNPPEGWESEGQLRIADCGLGKSQRTEDSEKMFEAKRNDAEKG